MMVEEEGRIGNSQWMNRDERRAGKRSGKNNDRNYGKTRQNDRSKKACTNSMPWSASLVGLSLFFFFFFLWVVRCHCVRRSKLLLDVITPMCLEDFPMRLALPYQTCLHWLHTDRHNLLRNCACIDWTMIDKLISVQRKGGRGKFGIQQLEYACIMCAQCIRAYIASSVDDSHAQFHSSLLNRCRQHKMTRMAQWPLHSSFPHFVALVFTVSSLVMGP